MAGALQGKGRWPKVDGSLRELMEDKGRVENLKGLGLPAPWPLRTLLLAPAAHSQALPNAQSYALLLPHQDPAS